MMERAIKYVEEIFSTDCSGHDCHHIMRVYRLAMKIAEQEHLHMVEAKDEKYMTHLRKAFAS